MFDNEPLPPDNVIPGVLLIILLLGVLLFVATGCAAVNKPTVMVQVMLVNKDIMSGKLKGMIDKKLRLDNKYAGLLTLDWKGVVSIETDNTSKIELKDGNIIFGRLLKAAPAKVNIVSDSTNSSNLSIYDIVSINRPEAKWGGKVTMKFSRFRGNTNTDQFGAKLKGSRESRNDKTSIKGSYDHAKTDGEVIAKKGDIKIKYDYKFSKQWYGYTSATTEYDRVAQLNQRNKVGLGLGFKAIENDDGKLIFELGTQFTNEDFETQTPDLDDHFSEGAASVEYERKLLKKLKYSAFLEVSVPYRIYDNWRANFETSLDYKLSDKIAIEIGFVLKSNQNPPPGIERNDKETYAGLSIEF